MVFIGYDAIVNYLHSRFVPLIPIQLERLVTWFDLSKLELKVFFGKCLLLRCIHFACLIYWL